MLVEGGYLHSMKRLIEKASALDEPVRRPPSRISRSARFVIGLLGGSSVAADRSRADETRRREGTSDPRRR